MKALEILAKYRGLLKETVELEIGDKLIEMLREGRQRNAEQARERERLLAGVPEGETSA